MRICYAFGKWKFSFEYYVVAVLKASFKLDIFCHVKMVKAVR